MAASAHEFELVKLSSTVSLQNVSSGKSTFESLQISSRYNENGLQDRIVISHQSAQYRSSRVRRRRAAELWSERHRVQSAQKSILHSLSLIALILGAASVSLVMAFSVPPSLTSVYQSAMQLYSEWMLTRFALKTF